MAAPRRDGLAARPVFIQRECQDNGMLRIAAELDIGSGTVQRMARDMRN
jgi:hypothetical protein